MLPLVELSLLEKPIGSTWQKSVIQVKMMISVINLRDPIQNLIPVLSVQLIIICT